jgi:hypothetical protein
MRTNRLFSFGFGRLNSLRHLRPSIFEQSYIVKALPARGTLVAQLAVDSKPFCGSVTLRKLSSATCIQSNPSPPCMHLFPVI